MAQQSSSFKLPTKFYLTKSVLGAAEGVYIQSELPRLPKEAHKYIIPLAVAAALGYVEYDHEATGHIEELPIHPPVDPATEQPKSLRGVKEGLIEKTAFKPGLTGKIETSTHKISNSLRDKISDMKKKQAEDSLKAKILAAKANKTAQKAD